MYNYKSYPDFTRTYKWLQYNIYLYLSKPTNISYKLVDTNKLSIIKEGPFKIKWQISKYTYELELSERLKHIHLVISIANLKQIMEDAYYYKINLLEPVIVNDEEYYIFD